MSWDWRVVRLAAVTVGLVGAPSSGGLVDAGAQRIPQVSVPDGFVVRELVTGLVRPTQIALVGDDVIVAQLNGGEGEGTGQVVRVALDGSGELEVLYADLLTPTGVAVLDDEVWVMEKRTLSHGPLNGGDLIVVLDEMPYNGRSEGTLTVTPHGRIMYDTSGTLDGIDAAAGSATLWALSPGSDPVPYATGFKHAYARIFGPDGTLWQTEVSDGRYDGEPAPDELVIVEDGDDFGWPQCVGDGRPVEFYDGTEEQCADAPSSFALFDPGATPTSVALAPWDSDVLLVSLWNEGRVVAIDATSTNLPAEADDFLTGIAHPQFLLADGDRLLVLDFDAGRILAVEPA